MARVCRVEYYGNIGMLQYYWDNFVDFVALFVQDLLVE